MAQIIADHKNYYTWENAARMSIVFGGGAILANTSLDQDFQNSWQNNIGQSSTLHAFKVFGEGLIVVPSYAAAMLVGATFDSPDGQFAFGLTDASGAYSLRLDSDKSGCTPGPSPTRSSARSASMSSATTGTSRRTRPSGKRTRSTVSYAL